MAMSLAMAVLGCSAIITHGCLPPSASREIIMRWKPVIFSHEGVVAVKDARALRRFTRAVICLRDASGICVLQCDDDVSAFCLMSKGTEHTVHSVLWAPRADREASWRAFYSWHDDAFPHVRLRMQRGAA